MNLRHATALALVGWYLMVPPIYQGHETDENGPLHQWKILMSFDTAQDCRIDQIQLIQQSAQRPPWHKKRVLDSACIATDDPRLKESSK